MLDQGNTSSCVWNALAACVQIVTGGPLISRLAGYAPTRAMGGEPRDRLIDDGCIPADAVAVATQYGVCLERDWTFDESKVNVMPPWDVLARASAYHVTAWERLASLGLSDEIARVLVAGYPVMFGMLVGPAYMNLAPGVVYANVEPNGGGHMQAIVGFRPSAVAPGTRDFRIQGSWSRAFCQSGFAWVHESVLTDPSSSDFYALHAAPAGIT